MNTVINDLHVYITKVDSKRTIYINGGDKPYEMVWNKLTFRWEFASPSPPEEVKDAEYEISNFIMQSEKLGCT